MTLLFRTNDSRADLTEELCVRAPRQQKKWLSFECMQIGIEANANASTFYYSAQADAANYNSQSFHCEFRIFSIFTEYPALERNIYAGNLMHIRNEREQFMQIAGRSSQFRIIWRPFTHAWRDLSEEKHDQETNAHVTDARETMSLDTCPLSESPAE